MRRGIHFIYCTEHIWSVKDRVCNNDRKDSRKNKPIVETKGECCCAKLEPLPQRQFHTCKTGFAGNEEWDSTIIVVAAQMAPHTAHSLGTCVSSLPLVLHSAFPTIPTRSFPSPFLPPAFTARILFPLALCAIPFGHSPSKSQCDTAEAHCPSRKDRTHHSCLLRSPYPHQYPLFSPS